MKSSIFAFLICWLNFNSASATPYSEIDILHNHFRPENALMDGVSARITDGDFVSDEPADVQEIYEVLRPCETDDNGQVYGDLCEIDYRRTSEVISDDYEKFRELLVVNGSNILALTGISQYELNGDRTYVDNNDGTGVTTIRFSYSVTKTDGSQYSYEEIYTKFEKSNIPVESSIVTKLVLDGKPYTFIFSIKQNPDNEYGYISSFTMNDEPISIEQYRYALGGQW